MENKNSKNVAKILNFWFGEIENGLSEEGKKQIWYQGNEDTDNFILDEFGTLFHLAADQKLSTWQTSPDSSLALVILLDQFSRNIYRGSEKAFATDPLALKYCLQGLADGHHYSMRLIEKIFYYHPLMHAESLSHQNTCVSLFETLLSDCNAGNIAYVENSLKFAYEHRDIIAEFGRFPHRNAVLGRQSTSSEEGYLADGGKRFGQ